MAGALAALALAAGPAAARPFTVEDLLRQESFGAIAADPTGHWLVVERRGPYAAGPRFDYDQDNAKAAARLWIVDLAHPGPARLLIPRVEPGQQIAAFSPDGRRLAITRLSGGRQTLGVVTLATGAVRWFPISPEFALYGRTVQWRTDRELLVIARPDRSLPWPLRKGRASAEDLPALWRASAIGTGAHTAVGSGALLKVRQRPPPRRLVRLDVLRGRRTTLASGELADLEISPDGRRIALLRLAEDLQSRGDRPAQGDWGLAIQAERLSVIDLATGREASLAADRDVLATLLAWSPDGRSLLVFDRAADTPWTEGALQRIAVATGEVQTLASGLQPVLRRRPEVVSAAWMGDIPLLLARPAGAAQARADWFRLTPDGPVNLTAALPDTPSAFTTLTSGGAIAVSGGGLWRLDPDGHDTPLISAGVADPRRPRAGADGRLLNVAGATGWVALEGGGGRRWLTQVTTAGLQMGAVLPADVTPLVLAPTAAAAVAFGGAVLIVYRPGATPSTVARLNPERAAVDAPRVLPIDHLGPEGQPLRSWLYLPPRPAGAPPPLVVKAYGGASFPVPPAPLAPPLGLVIDTRTLVGHGYAVLVPSLPIPRAAAHDPTLGVAAQILAIVDRAAVAPQTAGTFDPVRLALWGHSYGGLTVEAAITQSDRFRAAIAQSGISHQAAQWAALPVTHRTRQEEGVRSNYATGGVEGGQGNLGGPPWALPDRYQRNSPLYAASAIRTPLLLLHGDQDDVVALAQSEAMFSALYRQGKDAELVTYWGEGHWISSPGNVRDLYARAFAFLDDRLGFSGRETRAAPPRNPGPGPANGAPRPRPPRRAGPRAAAAR